LAGIVGSALGWFAALFSTTVRLQTVLNGAFTTLTAELQSEHARLIARASEAERQVTEREGEIQRMRGEIRSLQQWQNSAKNFCERSGVTLPAKLRDSEKAPGG
jgi:TolA-binding protein